MTSTFRVALSAAAALGALAFAHSTAIAQPGGGGACLRLSQINNTKLADPRTLYVRAGGNRYYRVGFSADCNDAVNETLVLHPFANDDEVCSPIALDISVRATGIRCIASSITRLSPDEVASIPAHDKP